MRGKLLNTRFSLIITLLCLGSLLTSLIWYNYNVEPHRLPAPKKSVSQLSDLCQDCMEVVDKVAENKTEISKKREDNLQKVREGNNKAGKQKSKISKKQEHNPQKFKKGKDKIVEQNSKISKKQEDNPQKVKEGNDKATPQNSEISKKQEDNPQKAKELNDKAVEQNSETSRKQEDNLQKVKEVILKAAQRYSQTWKRQENNYQKFRSKLSSKCHGLDRAIITQNNKPVGSKIVYDGNRKTLEVTPELFSIFMKDHPFSNKTFDTCAVVGNGGILINSSCGETINSAQFVIRCNLPPLSNGYKKHVGVKTDLVTANPSIFYGRYRAINRRHRRPFVESLRSYGNSLMLIPAFSFGSNTAISLRAFYTIKDFKSPIRPVFINPEYLKSLLLFWRSQGLKERRLSTGLFTASLALELCKNVHLYGFWPFSHHPHDLHPLTHHYYDDKKATRLHAMPAEFDLLMTLHSQGILRLHLGDCPTSGK